MSWPTIPSQSPKPRLHGNRPERSLQQSCPSSDHPAEENFLNKLASDGECINIEIINEHTLSQISTLSCDLAVDDQNLS